MDHHLRRSQIVKMQAKHIEDLTAVEKLCFSKPWSYESIAEELSNPLAVFFVAEDENGKVTGYAGMHHIVDEGYITNIAVIPDCRRHGIGKLLVRTLNSYAEKNGLALLTLEVRCSNKIAIDIYKEEGFDEEGIRRAFYDLPVEDGLIMTKYF